MTIDAILNITLGLSGLVLIKFLLEIWGNYLNNSSNNADTNKKNIEIKRDVKIDDWKDKNEDDPDDIEGKRDYA